MPEMGHIAVTNMLLTLTPCGGVRSVHAMEGTWRWVVAAAAVFLLIIGCGAGTDAERGAEEAAEADHGAAAPDAPTVEELLDRTSSYGGHVEQRRQSTDEAGNPQHAALTLRVPADHLSSLLQVETTLSERQADLEALQVRRNDLSDQVAMSTLELQLSTEPITEVQADGFLGGLQSGWNVLVSAANALLVAAGAMLPWLVVLAVPGAVVILLLRRRRAQVSRQQAETTAEASEQAGHPADPESGDRA